MPYFIISVITGLRETNCFTSIVIILQWHQTSFPIIKWGWVCSLLDCLATQTYYILLELYYLCYYFIFFHHLLVHLSYLIYLTPFHASLELLTFIAGIVFYALSCVNYKEHYFCRYILFFVDNVQLLFIGVLSSDVVPYIKSVRDRTLALPFSLE